MTTADLIIQLRRRIALVVSRCVLRLVNDQLKAKGVQISLLAGETRDNVELFQQYGFSSVPLPGAEGVALAIGGDRGHLIVVATEDRRYRPTGGEPGEVTIFDHQGSVIRLLANGDILLNPASGTTRVEGDLVATGNVSDESGSMNEIRGVFNAHKHSGGGAVPTTQMT
jgi:phage gp45-like